MPVGCVEPVVLIFTLLLPDCVIKFVVVPVLVVFGFMIVDSLIMLVPERDAGFVDHDAIVVPDAIDDPVLTTPVMVAPELTGSSDPL